MEPVGTVHLSGDQLLVSQTRKTLPTVVEHNRWLPGDHFSSAAGNPMRFNGVFRLLSTHQISISVSLTLAVASRVPLWFHSTEVTGKWFPLKLTKKLHWHNWFADDWHVVSPYLLKWATWERGRMTWDFGSSVHNRIPLWQPTANSPADNGRHAIDVMHFWNPLFITGTLFMSSV